MVGAPCCSDSVSSSVRRAFEHISVCVLFIQTKTIAYNCDCTSETRASASTLIATTGVYCDWQNQGPTNFGPKLEFYLCLIIFGTHWRSTKSMSSSSLPFLLWVSLSPKLGTGLKTRNNVLNSTGKGKQVSVTIRNHHHILYLRSSHSECIMAQMKSSLQPSASNLETL